MGESGKLIQKLALALEAERLGALAEFRRELKNEGLCFQVDLLEAALTEKEDME